MAVAQDERSQLIDQIKRIAQEADSDSVPRHEFLRRSGTSERKISKLFGSYNGLVEAANLTPQSFGQTYSDEYIINEVLKVLRQPEAQLTRIYFDRQQSVSTTVCERRFGGWINTLKEVLKHLDSKRDKNLIDRIKEYIRPPISSEDDSSEQKPVLSPREKVTESHPGHTLIDQTARSLYGDFLNFRGLQHCPVNEQGVVFLFGMVCRELGYVVEIVRAGFPDCEAKRRVRGRDGLWQRVRIEFEYQSKNFRSHGHDPDQCDVIVCWVHNWPDCPIEILELKSALDALPGQVNGV